jgi:ATP-dependent DNA ligase
MNIFEFLDSPVLRKKEKMTQKVKNYDEVSAKSKPFPMYVQIKEDGNYCMRVKYKGKVANFSRTGEMLNNLEGAYEEALIADGVYICEVVNYSMSLEQLSGAISSERVNPLDKTTKKLMKQVQFKYFDFLSIKEFLDGESQQTYLRRHEWLVKNIRYLLSILPYTKVDNEEMLRKIAKRVINSGKEGVVVKQDLPWKAGHKGKHQMKIVRGIDVDLECIGWEEGTGKYEGKVANLIFRYKDGKEIKAMLGKGWTHDMARNLFFAILEHKNSPIGKIFQVYGLQPSSKNGLIRLPKVGELRFDKTEADY